MAAVMKVTVEKTDGSRNTYAVLPKTQVAFERHFKVGLAAAQGENARLEFVYWLAWDAEHTAGNVVKPFDSWLDDIVAVEPESDPGPLEG